MYGDHLHFQRSGGRDRGSLGRLATRPTRQNWQAAGSVRDPALGHKAESDRGRHLTSALDLYTHRHTWAYVCPHMQIHAHAHTHTDTHTHTQTHTQVYTQTEVENNLEKGEMASCLNPLEVFVTSHIPSLFFLRMNEQSWGPLVQW